MNKFFLNKIKLFFVAYSILFLSCDSGSTSPVTGGNEVPNMFSATIVDNSGIAVADASVNLSVHTISSSGSCVPRTISVNSDSTGLVTLKTITPGSYVLTVNKEDKGYINSSLVISRDIAYEAGEIQIKEKKLVRGRVLTSKSMDNSALNIFIPGLKNLASPDSLGFYTIESVPQGRLDLVAGYGNIVNYVPVEIIDNSSDTVYIRDITYATELSQASGTYMQYNVTDFTNSFSVLPIVYPANKLPDWYSQRSFGGVNYFTIDSQGELSNFSEFVTEAEAEYDSLFTEGLLIHNFNIGVAHQNALSIILADIHNIDIEEVGGWWYGYNDINSGMEQVSVISPDITQEPPVQAFEQALVEDGAYSGKSLKFNFNLGSGPMRPYAGIGFEIAGDSENIHDFSDLDSLIFYAKGSGTFRVKILSNGWDDWLNDNIGLGRNISLSQNWVRFAVSVAQLNPDNDSQAQENNIVWDNIKNNIRKIQFETIGTQNENLELWIDNIYLKGLSINDINFP